MTAEWGLPRAAVNRILSRPPQHSIVGARAVVLGVQLPKSISTALFESGARATLRHRFADLSGFHVLEVRLARESGGTVLRAVVRGPNTPSAAQVATAQPTLPSPPNGSAVRLRVRFVETDIVTRLGPATEDGDGE